jgi:hypothetical protein
MNIATGDILNYNSMICLNCDFLIRNTDINANYLRVAKSRAKQAGSKNAAWKFVQIQNKDYFVYDNIPGRYREQLPEINTLATYAIQPKNEVETLINRSLIDGFKTFQSLYSTFGKNKALALAQSAAIIHESKNHIEIKGLSYSKSDFFEQLADEISLQGLKYLPKSWRNLRDKIRLYADGIPLQKIVTPKNEGNGNAAVFLSNDLIVGWLIELAHSQKNYPAAFIFRKLRLMCSQSGIEKYPSVRWVSDFMARPKTKYLIKERYGDGSRHNQQYRAYTPTQTAVYAGDAWQIDGTRVNIIDHKASVTDKDGKRKGVNKFLYIVAVRDVMSGLPLGWEYCYEENVQAVIGALAMAVRNAGYLPYELIYDRFPGHNTSEWAFIEYELHRAGTITTVAHKAEGKAHMERWFGTLQSVFMTESDLYYGEGVRSSRRYAHRSKEYVARMHQWVSKHNFKFDDAVRETNEFLEKYIHTPYSSYSRKYQEIDRSPLQLHDESDKPHTYPVPEPQYCYLFGIRREVSIRNNMIQTQIEGVTHYYGIDDCNLTEQYTGEQLTNCFDHEDLSRVHLFAGEHYLGTFDEFTPAQRFGPEKNMRAVGKMKKIAADNEAHRTRRLLEIDARKRAAEARMAPDTEADETTSEVGILLAGRLKKHACEAAETVWLNELWEVEEELEINTRERY